MLFDIFYEWPSLANLIGLYPKVLKLKQFLD